jgi:hypothetical protein
MPMHAKLARLDAPRVFDNIMNHSGIKEFVPLGLIFRMCSGKSEMGADDENYQVTY